MDLRRPPCDAGAGLATVVGERQLVLVTGKGGVGKTTLTAAIARALQSAGRRTLVAEVTSDVAVRSQLLGHFGLGAARGEHPVAIGPRLDGVRITPATGHRLFLRAALRVGVLADAAMRSAALNRFLIAAPAFPEIGTLYQLVWLLRQGQYEHLVIDLPATGHALGLAKLPRTVSRVVPKGLIRDAIVEGLGVLNDPARCAAIVGTLPERLPVTEAFELVRGLRDLDVPVGAVILNRMPHDPFTEDERRALDEHVRGKRGELLLGTRELRRIERALAARQTFMSGSLGTARGVEVPELAGSWPEVIEAMARHLVAAELVPAPVARAGGMP